MPQMAPYNWMILFILFNLIMMTYSSYNNFTKIPSFLNIKKIYKINYFWKW